MSVFRKFLFLSRLKKAVVVSLAVSLIALGFALPSAHAAVTAPKPKPDGTSDPNVERVRSNICFAKFRGIEYEPFGTVAAIRYKNGKRKAIFEWSGTHDVTVRGSDGSFRALRISPHWVVIDGRGMKPPRYGTYSFWTKGNAHRGEFVWKMYDARYKRTTYAKCKTSVDLTKK